jgi:hypothetical protein
MLITVYRCNLCGTDNQTPEAFPLRFERIDKVIRQTDGNGDVHICEWCLNVVRVAEKNRSS